MSGTRQDLGQRFGILQTQIALALNGRDRDEALSVIAGLLAEHSRASGLKA